MKPILSLALFLLTGLALNAQQAGFQLAYVDRYKNIAIREMERTGIPASIKLAQGILESDSGRSYLATTANNHFGIKCGSQWMGERVYRKDDDFDDKGRLIESCFRRYQNPDASYVAHSEFLLDPKKTFRYGFLFRLPPTDYKKWAKGLKQAGYATNPRYPDLLIDLIERYDLNRYDREPTQGPKIPDFNPVPPVVTTEPNRETRETRVTAGVYRANDVKYFQPDGGMTLEEIAKIVDVSVRRLIDYNEYPDRRDGALAPSERVYIQPKRSNYRGKEKYHAVREGETLFEISQRYGIRLDKLRSRNRVPEGLEPAVGSLVKLRGGKLSAPLPTRSNRPIKQPQVTPPVKEEPKRDTSVRLDMDESDPIDIFVPSRPPVSTPPPPPPPPVRPQTPPSTQGKVIPSGAPTKVEPSPTTPPAPATGQNIRYHVVEAGDTLYNISRRYNISVEELRQLNQLSGNIINIGQRLRVSKE